MDPNALRRLDEAVQQAGGGRWKVVDFCQDFDRLWGDNLEVGNLLIVWDGMPSDLDTSSVNIKDQLTPFDWAVSFSNLLLNAGKDAPPFRLIILDLFSLQMSNAFGCRMADSLVAAFPWLSVIRLLPANHERSSADTWNPEKLKELLREPDRLEVLNRAGDSREIVKMFVQAWLGNLARDETHHDVNNLLGPMLLLEGIRGTSPGHEDTPSQIGEGNSGSSALLCHIRRLCIDQLKPPGAAPTASIANWDGAARLAAELDKEIRFILVDDQANTGWSSFVAHALGISSPLRQAERGELTELGRNGRVALFAATSPHPILSKLEEMLQSERSNEGARDWRFQLALTGRDEGAGRADAISAGGNGLSNEPLEILLLDLRLTSGLNEGRRLHERIVRLSEAVRERLSGDWPWKEIVTSSAGETQDNCEFERLTLLPRLIATADLSLPIIVFSSTGQRSVVQAFKDFGTIITDFEKPRLLGAFAAEIFAAANAQWNSAMNRASDILRARWAVERLPIAEETILPATTARMCNSDSDTVIVDLFTDEQGDEFRGETLKISGLLVTHRSSSAADDFHKDPRLSALVTGFPKRRNTEDYEEYRERIGNWKSELRRRVPAHLRELDSLAIDYGAQLAIVSLEGSYGASGDPTELAGVGAQGQQADDLYRAMIAALTEAAIYHLVPMEASGTFDYRICFATRVVGITQYKKSTRGKFLKDAAGRKIIDPEATAEMERRAARDKRLWGVRLENNRLQYLGTDAARPLVQGICRSYGAVESPPTPVHARAYVINRSPEDSGAPALHYLADALLSKQNDHIVGDLKGAGFAGLYDDSVRVMLNAARVAANGLTGRAISISSRDGLDTPPSEPNDILYLLRRRLAGFALSMSGAEFMIAVDDIRTERNRPALWEGTVLRDRQETNQCRIKTSDDRVTNCPLPLPGEQWLFNGDHVRFWAWISHDGEFPVLEFVELVEVTEHPAWLKLVRPGAILTKRAIDHVQGGEAFITCGQFIGIWSLSDDDAEEARKGSKRDFVIESVDYRKQIAAIRLATAEELSGM